MGNKEKSELNLLVGSIPTDGTNYHHMSDYSLISRGSDFDKVEAVFRNQEWRLIHLIEEYSAGAIFGCVAWLTSTPILKALATCTNVQIIVQKEDFLRPDINARNTTSWKSELRRLYNSISCGFTRYEFQKPICLLSTCSDPQVEGIRCVGNYNSTKNPAFPRMHHKFLVFCRVDDSIKSGVNYFPEVVWTGSFNLTRNATMSFENNIILTDKSGKNPMIEAYLREHHQLFGLSEQLDWTSEWVQPEFRIGS